MKLLFAGNNWLGWQALHFLREQGEDIVGLALHPVGRRKYEKEIVATAGVSSDKILDGASLNTPTELALAKSLGAEAVVSVLFGYIFRAPFLESFPRGGINLHPSLLPYNRGQYPNVWSIIDGTPSGVTLHHIDPGIDTGDIIAQREVTACPWDTGETLYRKLEQAGIELLRESWIPFREGRALRRTQVVGMGTSHRTMDVAKVDEIDLNGTYTGRALIDILRARTFPPYRGAYFRAGARKVHLRLHLEYEDEA